MVMRTKFKGIKSLCLQFQSCLGFLIGPALDGCIRCQCQRCTNQNGSDGVRSVQIKFPTLGDFGMALPQFCLHRLRNTTLPRISPRGGSQGTTLQQHCHPTGCRNGSSGKKRYSPSRSSGGSALQYRRCCYHPRLAAVDTADVANSPTHPLLKENTTTHGHDDDTSHTHTVPCYYNNTAFECDKSVRSACLCNEGCVPTPKQHTRTTPAAEQRGGLTCRHVPSNLVLDCYEQLQYMRFRIDCLYRY